MKTKNSTMNDYLNEWFNQILLHLQSQINFSSLHKFYQKLLFIIWVTDLTYGFYTIKLCIIII